MPMHVSDNPDRGGNDTQVRFFDRGTNMHDLWDSGMIERIGKTETFWLNDLAALDTPEDRQAAYYRIAPSPSQNSGPRDECLGPSPTHIRLQRHV